MFISQCLFIIFIVSIGGILYYIKTYNKATYFVYEKFEVINIDGETEYKIKLLLLLGFKYLTVSKELFDKIQTCDYLTIKKNKVAEIWKKDGGSKKR